MYENFTERSRRVLQLANHETRKFTQDGQPAIVNTGHLLIALHKEGSGVAATVLTDVLDQYTDSGPYPAAGRVAKMLHKNYKQLEVEEKPGRGFSKVVEYAFHLAEQERIELKHEVVGTEHLLLGLLKLIEEMNDMNRDSDADEGEKLCHASDMLDSGIGAYIEEIRSRTLEILGAMKPEEKESHDDLPFKGAMMEFYSLYERICRFTGSETAGKLGNELISAYQQMDKLRATLQGIGNLVQDVGNEHMRNKINSAFQKQLEDALRDNKVMKEALVQITGDNCHPHNGFAIAKQALDDITPKEGQNVRA